MTYQTLLSPAELAAYWTAIAKIDAQFARISREFYEGCTALELKSLAIQAHNLSEKEYFVLANSYLALAA